jgi:hypothetical protein
LLFQERDSKKKAFVDDLNAKKENIEAFKLQLETREKVIFLFFLMNFI